jgi:hypothetical protein
MKTKTTTKTKEKTSTSDNYSIAGFFGHALEEERVRSAGPALGCGCFCCLLPVVGDERELLDCCYQSALLLLNSEHNLY